MYSIVVADDENMEREALRYIIAKSKLPFAVIGEAENGTEAINIVNKLHPDIVMINIKMPEKTGLEAIPEIMNVNPRVLIVVNSAYDELYYIKQALDFGVFGYLFKPASPNEIIKMLNDIEAFLSSSAPPDLT